MSGAQVRERRRTGADDEAFDIEGGGDDPTFGTPGDVGMPPPGMMPFPTGADQVPQDDPGLLPSVDLHLPAGMTEALKGDGKSPFTARRQNNEWTRLDMENDLDRILAEFEYGDRKCKVILTRDSPDYHPGDFKRECKMSGHLETYTKIVTVDDVKRAFGGGEFRIAVMGPDSRRQGKFGRLAGFQLDIAGEPLMPGFQPGKVAGGAGGDFNLIKEILATKDKELAGVRMQQENVFKELREMQAKDPLAGVRDVMEQQRLREQEERRAKEEREEKRRLEEIDRLDRIEERRRQEKKEEEDKRERERKEEEKLRKEQEEKKEQVRRDEEKARKEAEEKKEREERERRDRLEREERDRKDREDKDRRDREERAEKDRKDREEREERRREEERKDRAQLQDQMQQMQQSMLTMVTSAASEKTDLLTKFLSQKQDPLDSLDKIMTIATGLDKLRGGGDDDGEDRIERYIDKGSAMLEKLVAGSRFNAPAKKKSVIKRPAAGTAVAVDIPQETAPAGAPVVTPDPQANPKLEAPKATDEGAFVREMVIPGEDVPGDQFVKILVENLDIAVGKNMSPLRMFDEVIKKFPRAKLLQLKAVTADTVWSTVQEHGKDRLIGTPKGEEFVRELYALVAKAK